MAHFEILALETPILLMAWRRPHTLSKVIDSIRQVAPCRLFVACDGPNDQRVGEADLVALTRRVVSDQIDWPCTIEQFYSPVNLGCRDGVTSAINWFFNHVSEGIILEDDCVAHPDFYHFCTTLLEYYRNDMRIWCISGNNFQDGKWRGSASYYFSRYNHCWGWASWRNRWIHYDAAISKWPLVHEQQTLKSIFEDPSEVSYWTSIFNRLYSKNQPDTWDYQWSLACFLNSGLTALPNVNLVANVGFGPGATHTLHSNKKVPSAQSLGTISHPLFVIRDSLADRYTFNNAYLCRSR